MEFVICICMKMENGFVYVLLYSYYHLPFLLLYRSQSKMSGGLKNKLMEPRNLPVTDPYF